LHELGRQGASQPLSQVRLHAPIERPPSIRDFMTFEQHIKTARLLVNLAEGTSSPN